MSNSSNSSSSAGIGFTGILTIVFIVLKLDQLVKVNSFLKKTLDF